MRRPMTMHWPPREVGLLRTRLDELAEIVRVPDDDLPRDARDWLARLLVIRSSGFLEQSTMIVCREYVRASAGGPVHSFARSWLDRSGNPAPDVLLRLTGRFDRAWATELGEILDADDERFRRELEFLVDRRNKIAHGFNESVGVAKALALKEVACEVSDWFVARFNPQR